MLQLFNRTLTKEDLENFLPAQVNEPSMFQDAVGERDSWQDLRAGLPCQGR